MDWNSDGQLDIVSGDRNGYFNVFIRQDTSLVGFRQYRLMDSTILDVGSNSQPAVIDWNGDGKKDLILGTETGYIHFYPNLAADTWPMFQTYSYIDVEGSPIYLYRVNPYVFDLDRDGVNDLICGSNDGYVRFYRNTGTNVNPVLAQPETLRTVDGTPIQPPAPYPYGARCGFGFWNGDTVPDLLLSGYDGTVVLYLGEPMVGVEEQLPGPSPVVLSVQPAVGRPPFSITFVGENPDRTSSTALTIFDATGRTVRTLSVANPVVWDGTDHTGRKVSPGIYFCRLNQENRPGVRLVLTGE